MPRLTYLTLTFLFVAGNCLSSRSDDTVWNGWLGPQRNGWVSGFQPPVDWPEKLTRRWQAQVGTGYGSLLVADGRVYQHSRHGDHEVVSCLNLESGEVEWRKSYEAPFTMGGGGEYHGKGPKSCPAFVDGRLFTLSMSGILSAWDMTSGRLLWRKDYNDQFEKSHPNWGATTSPLIDGTRVIVHFGGDEEGFLAAIDFETGEEVWRNGKDGASYASPLLVEIAGVRQVVEWNHRVLAGVDVESGDFMWEFPFPHIGTDQNMPTPAFYQGRVLLGGENRGVLGIDPKRNNGIWTTERAWHQKTVALDMSTAVINAGLLFGFSHYDKGRLFCLDPESGDVRWRGPGRTGQNVTFLSMPGHVAALINTGELRIIKATGERYTEIAAWRVAENQTWAPPVLVRNGILIKDVNTLTLWSFSP